MKITAQVKLNVTLEQESSLLKTLEITNFICNQVSRYAFVNRLYHNFDLHKVFYHILKAESKLSAQILVRVFSKVGDSYKTNKKTLCTFKPHGAISYDAKILRWYIDLKAVSIWTIDGRLHIPYFAGEKQLELLKHQKGESDLVYDRVSKQFYLMAVCDIEEAEVQKTTDEEVLGVDMGLVNLATTSDGKMYSGDQIEKTRKRYKRLKSALQSKGTKSAKRHLKKMSKRQSRFQKDVNHVISKKLVTLAKDTNRRIHVEDLTGISKRTTAWTKDNKHRLGNWAFYQLQYFIAYKARMLGVEVKQVDSAYTSQRCNNCGHIDKANRPSQAEFLCVNCRHKDHADVNAAKNVAFWTNRTNARRAVVNQPIVANISVSDRMGELQAFDLG